MTRDEFIERRQAHYADLLGRIAAATGMKLVVIQLVDVEKVIADDADTLRSMGIAPLQVVPHV